MIFQRCVVLFCDVHEFSKAVVALGDGVGELVQEIYATLGDRIVASHGTIVKYMGDAMLAVFSDKAEIPAVRCALEMRSRFRDLVEHRGLGAAMELEVAVTAGRVVRGTFGHPSLRIEDVFGEAVNIAAVIGHRRGVTVTEPVMERVKESVGLEPLSPCAVKWRAEPIRIWGVVEGATPARG